MGEVLAALEPRDHALYVDGTFGGGGYSRALLKAADCKVAAIDRDPDAVARGADMAREFPGRLEVLHGRIGDMDAVLGARGTTSVDGGIVFDLGLSSIQLDDPARGFSFRHDGPLDMRLEPCGATAADIVASADEDGLTKIIRRYGEERYAGRVARAIVAARPITTTGELARERAECSEEGFVVQEAGTDEVRKILVAGGRKAGFTHHWSAAGGGGGHNQFCQQGVSHGGGYGRPHRADVDRDKPEQHEHTHFKRYCGSGNHS